MSAVDSALPFTNAAAGTSPVFPLKGGRYMLEIAAGGSGGTVGLQKLGPDGVTFIPVPPITAALTAAGAAVYDLSGGNFQLVVTTLTAIFASIVRLPND